MKKTTINIEDAVMERLKEEAARRRTTMTALIEAGIRRILGEEQTATPVAGELPPLPVYDMGEPLVDVADRDALYEVLDRERDERLYKAGPSGTGSNALRTPEARAVAEDAAPYDADRDTYDRPDDA